MTIFILTSLAIFLAFNATVFIAAFQHSQARSVSNKEEVVRAESRKMNNFLYQLASNTTYLCWLTLAFFTVVILYDKDFGVFFTGTLLILWLVFMMLIQHAVNELGKYSRNLGS